MLITFAKQLLTMHCELLARILNSSSVGRDQEIVSKCLAIAHRQPKFKSCCFQNVGQSFAWLTGLGLGGISFGMFTLCLGHPQGAQPAHTPTSKTIDFQGLFDNIEWSRATGFRPLSDDKNQYKRRPRPYRHREVSDCACRAVANHSLGGVTDDWLDPE